MKPFALAALAATALSLMANTSTAAITEFKLPMERSMSIIAPAKTVKEARYQRKFSTDWMIRLGDGTEESHRRMQEALDYLWPYVGEMFQSDEADAEMVKAGIAPDPASLREEYDALISRILGDATLTIPESRFAHKGGRTGAMHTEHLGHLLTQMQWLQRAYPGAKW